MHVPKPLIGISITERKVVIHMFGKQPLAYVNAMFCKVVGEFGGLPVLLTAQKFIKIAKENKNKFVAGDLLEIEDVRRVY